jgi:transposase InsO family protein
MVIDMQEERLDSIEALEQFLAGTAGVSPRLPGGEAARQAHVQRVLGRFGYAALSRRHKGVVVRYLQHTSGYSRQHLVRLIGRFVAHTPLGQRRAPVAGFYRRYTEADVLLVAHTDALHDTPSGPAAKRLFERAWQLYGDARYERLAAISVAHLYNLRATARYQGARVNWQGTRATKTVAIGVRRAPRPEGRAGFIRIDSVHQGDRDGAKGVYHINAVDCVTQWEVVASCERISEAYLLPVLTELLAAFPFTILGVHADNGSEYVNHRVARLLGKLNAELTRSRPRHSNDNALVETKNGAVVRKFLGYSHIPQRFAAPVNAFCRDYLNPYLNLHRPVPVRPGARRCQGQGPQALPAAPRTDSAREARQSEPGVPQPAPRPHLASPAGTGARPERQCGRRAATQGPRGVVRIHQPTAHPSRRLTPVHEPVQMCTARLTPGSRLNAHAFPWIAAGQRWRVAHRLPTGRRLYTSTPAPN